MTGIVVVWVIPAVALLAVRRGGFRNPVDAQLEREPWRREP